MLYRLSSMAKAIVAALASGATALGVAAQDGAIDTGDFVAVAVAVIGALGVTYAVPNKS